MWDSKGHALALSAAALVVWSTACRPEIQCDEGEIDCVSTVGVRVCRSGQWNSTICPSGLTCLAAQGCFPPSCDNAPMCVSQGSYGVCINGTVQSMPCPTSTICASVGVHKVVCRDMVSGYEMTPVIPDATSGSDAGPTADGEAETDGAGAGDAVASDTGTADAATADAAAADAASTDAAASDAAAGDAVAGDTAPKECPVSVEGGVCDDFAGCTIDECDTKTGTCTHTPSDLWCNDGSPCTEDKCVADGNSFKCSHAPLAGTCSDNDGCTVGDTCSQGKCQGTPKPCNDGNVCTTDGCLADCTHTPIGVPCEADGSVCTSDLCEGGTCKAGTPIACDDQNPCTADACDPTVNCTYVPVAAGTACNDGLPCTQPDTCQAGACSGTPMTCDPGLECLAGTCAAPTPAWTTWKPPPTPQGLVPDAAAGTVYHPLTGRTWQRAASAATMNWTAAQDTCNALILAGKDDWRLPTAVELMSLLDLSKTTNSALIDLVAFPDTPEAAFWTGTQYSISSLVVALNFDIGAGGPVEQGSKNYVRCVR